MNQNNIIFLYAELTPYLIGCLQSFIEENSNLSIRVYYHNVFNKLDLNITSIEFIDRKIFKNELELYYDVKKNKPKVLLISGRMDKGYLFVAKKFKNTIQRVCLFDTIYRNDILNLIKKLFSKYLYKQYFDVMWGVGKLQEKFALEIGYKSENIRNGFYVADKKFSDNNFTPNFHRKNYNFLFIGRLVKEKNILNFAQAIENLNNKTNSNHKLGVIGEGYLKPSIINFSCTNYLGSKTQDEIISISHNYQAFCLPSIYEPWGVVLHEMASIGMPILSSDQCGSAYDLIEDGKNGFKFNPHSIKSIENSLIKFISLTLHEKIKFSERSKEISKKINHIQWNNNLLGLLK